MLVDAGVEKFSLRKELDGKKQLGRWILPTAIYLIHYWVPRRPVFKIKQRLKRWLHVWFLTPMSGSQLPETLALGDPMPLASMALHSGADPYRNPGWET